MDSTWECATGRRKKTNIKIDNELPVLTGDEETTILHNSCIRERDKEGMRKWGKQRKAI